jgi:hypothetical protein
MALVDDARLLGNAAKPLAAVADNGVPAAHGSRAALPNWPVQNSRFPHAPPFYGHLRIIGGRPNNNDTN